jgi:hypothetical protein
MAINVLAVSVDGSDVTKLAGFWADVLDQPVNPGATTASRPSRSAMACDCCSTKSRKARSSRTAST